MNDIKDTVHVNGADRVLSRDYVRVLRQKMGFFHTWGLILKVILWDALFGVKAGLLGWVVKLTMPIGYLYLVAYGSLPAVLGFLFLGGFVANILFDLTKGYKALLLAYWAYAFWVFVLLSPIISIMVWFTVSKGNTYLSGKSWKIKVGHYSTLGRSGNYELRD